MTGLVRAAATGGFAVLVWVVVAAQLPSQARIPVAGVVAGATVTQPFGCTSLALEPYDPFCPGRHVHTGIDLAAPMGTPVRSATAGTAHLGLDPEAGRYVVVTFDAHVRIFYCHLETLDAADGAPVIPGQRIGTVGQTGLATGPHVHLEVQVDGQSVDPATWLSS
jgi:murein DD-endopeptidase MepM/ murein hydrolase activator NlpD